MNKEVLRPQIAVYNAPAMDKYNRFDSLEEPFFAKMIGYYVTVFI